MKLIGAELWKIKPSVIDGIFESFLMKPDTFIDVFANGSPKLIQSSLSPWTSWTEKSIFVNCSFEHLASVVKKLFTDRPNQAILIVPGWPDMDWYKVCG